MEQQNKEGTLIPEFLKGQWNVVRLGHWAGVFILASAPLIAVWQAVFLSGGEQLDFQTQLWFFWSTLVQIGSAGVIIILLAALLDRVSDEGDSRENSKAWLSWEARTAPSDPGGETQIPGGT